MLQSYIDAIILAVLNHISAQVASLRFLSQSDSNFDSVGEFREVARNELAKHVTRAYLDLVFQLAISYDAYSK